MAVSGLSVVEEPALKTVAKAFVVVTEPIVGIKVEPVLPAPVATAFTPSINAITIVVMDGLLGVIVETAVIVITKITTGNKTETFARGNHAHRRSDMGHIQRDGKGQAVISPYPVVQDVEDVRGNAYHVHGRADERAQADQRNYHVGHSEGFAKIHSELADFYCTLTSCLSDVACNRAKISLSLHP
ncbi:hypothetical protein OUZ56_012879 [Daphnia magna]|uniref:Uncharacterized protein n=1 Tax=Daphnia magna TaxID=35525 RepID=A0ABQ9Z4B4_9CRUS|nr:hypothetical protein OUZ56_012879 [Daphnia magna]